VPKRPHQRSGKHRGGPPQGRKKPPPDETGEERRFLIESLKADRRLAVELTDGSHARGIVRRFNEQTIDLQTEDREVHVRKSQIRYIEELD